MLWGQKIHRPNLNNELMDLLQQHPFGKQILDLAKEDVIIQIHLDMIMKSNTDIAIALFSIIIHLSKDNSLLKDTLIRLQSVALAPKVIVKHLGNENESK